MLSVSDKHIMLSVIMSNVAMLSVIMPNVVVEFLISSNKTILLIKKSFFSSRKGSDYIP